LFWVEVNDVHSGFFLYELTGIREGAVLFANQKTALLVRHNLRGVSMQYFSQRDYT